MEGKGIMMNRDVTMKQKDAKSIINECLFVCKQLAEEKRVT